MEQSYACVKSVRPSQGPVELCTGSKKICPENDCNPHGHLGVETVRSRPTHSLSHECHVQEAKEQDTSKKVAATRRPKKSHHNTLPDHDVLLRARLAQSHRRLR